MCYTFVYVRIRQLPAWEFQHVLDSTFVCVSEYPSRPTWEFQHALNLFDDNRLPPLLLGVLTWAKHICWRHQLQRTFSKNILLRAHKLRAACLFILVYFSFTDFIFSANEVRDAKELEKKKTVAPGRWLWGHKINRQPQTQRLKAPCRAFWLNILNCRKGII